MTTFSFKVIVQKPTIYEWFSALGPSVEVKILFSPCSKNDVLETKTINEVFMHDYSSEFFAKKGTVSKVAVTLPAFHATCVPFSVEKSGIWNKYEENYRIIKN